MYAFASLSEEQIAALRAYEKEQGVKLLAVSEVELDPAPIDAADLAKVQALEEQLGVCLVAVR